MPVKVSNAKMPRRMPSQYQNQVMQDLANFTSMKVGLGDGQDSMPNPNMISMKFNGTMADAMMENLSNNSKKYEISNILRNFGSGDINANLTEGIDSGRIGRDISAANYARERLIEFNSVSFFIRSNGTMVLPSPIGIAVAENAHKELVMPASMVSEYSLRAGQSSRLTYSGTLQFANGRLGVKFKPGKRYTIVVLGTGGAKASINVTAS